MIKRKYFDKEYSTTFLREIEYLKEQNIEPCYIKKVEDTVIYKFEKTKELFFALAKFYNSPK